MEKQNYVIVTKTFICAGDDIEARKHAREIGTAVTAMMPMMPSHNLQWEVKLQRLVPGKEPEGVKL